MEREDLDLVVLTNQKNIEYLTDYRSLSWGYHARPMFAFVDARCVWLVLNKIEARNFESQPRHCPVLYYEGYQAEGAHALIAEIVARNPQSLATIAIDYGQDMYGRGSLELVYGLREYCARNPLKSAGAALWRARMIKSSFEASQKRVSFAIVNAAFDAAVANAKLGITEIELCRQIQAYIAINGADRIDPITMVFSRGVFNYSHIPGTKQLQAGQYAWTDFRSTYGGYPADRNRIARGGAPEPWEIETYGKTRSLTIALASGVRAGMTCADVFQSFERLWRDAGLPPIYDLVSRIGHGGGLDVTEPPSISRNNPQPILPGMILHLEPKLELGGAVFQFEEIIYVREDGVEFLSELSPERMPIIN
jgi:Xaa-Pro aminopeptidase